MKSIYQLQRVLSACIVLSAVSVRSITVKYGTNDGPISPPPPTSSTEAPRPPYREPAPVWEESRQDIVDPNANWRPPVFVPQTRYTQVVYNLPPSPVQQPPPQTNAQRFVSQYLPRQLQQDPISANQQVNKTEQKIYNNVVVPELSAQSVPGVGIRYFIPYYEKVSPQQIQKEESKKEHEAKYNDIESNDIPGGQKDAANDVDLKYEKEYRRSARTLFEGTPSFNNYNYNNLNYYRHPWTVNNNRRNDYFYA